jgi:GntR family transcriptional regulator
MVTVSKSVATALTESRPKWLQIAAALRTEIETMVNEGQSRLPTESILSERFGVSLMTLRQALGVLESEGLIERRPRHGTTITARARQPRHIYTLGKVSDVFEQQKTDSTRVLSARSVKTPALLAELFPGQENVRRLIRSRSIDGRPCNYAVNHMREEVAQALDFNLLESLSVSEAISKHTTFDIEQMDQEISAQVADPILAQHLAIEPLDAVIILTGTGYDENGQVLDVARIAYRADMTRFLSRVSR